MNLILFVLSLILILAAMTYSRFEGFMQSQMQVETWREILIGKERDRYNQHQKNCKTPKIKHVRKKTEEKPKTEKETPTEPKTSTPAGSGQISLAWLIDKKFREKNLEANKEMMELMNDLLTQQWKEQPFYKRLAKENPQFIRSLLNEMIDTAERSYEEKKGVRNLDHFIMMDWSDLALKTAFGRMLQEGLVYDKKNKRDEGSPDVVYETPRGFQSLRDFFTNKNYEKIRVWLAPRAILLAIFRDPAIVDEIIKMRKELYSEVRKEGSDKNALSKQFQEAFSSKTVYKEVLDWHVTTTKAPKS